MRSTLHQHLREEREPWSSSKRARQHAQLDLDGDDCEELDFHSPRTQRCPGAASSVGDGSEVEDGEPANVGDEDINDGGSRTTYTRKSNESFELLGGTRSTLFYQPFPEERHPPLSSSKRERHHEHDLADDDVNSPLNQRRDSQVGSSQDGITGFEVESVHPAGNAVEPKDLPRGDASEGQHHCAPKDDVHGRLDKMAGCQVSQFGPDGDQGGEAAVVAHEHDEDGGQPANIRGSADRQDATDASIAAGELTAGLRKRPAAKVIKRPAAKVVKHPVAAGRRAV
jgi:hypothetical protein